MKIFAEERQQKIAELISSKGRATVPELADVFEISDITIRRDLLELEKKGLLLRTHGGAIKNLKTSQELFFEEQLTLNVDEKRNIAKFATSLLDEGDSIILESSTTNFYFSEYLPDIRNLKIFTNSPSIVSNIRNSDKDIEVICTGGYLKKDTNCLVGYDTVDYFSRINADKAFISIGALSEDGIMTIASREEMEVKKSIMRSASKVIVLSDSSKFNSRLLHKIGSIESTDILVTDQNIQEKLFDRLLKLKIEVHTV